MEKWPQYKFDKSLSGPLKLLYKFGEEIPAPAGKRKKILQSSSL